MSIDFIRRAARIALTDVCDMLLDRRCSGCGGSAPRDGEICAACDALVDRTGVAFCLRCLHGDAVTPEVARGCPSHGSARLLLAGPRFEPPLDRLIHAFKYEGVSALAPWVASVLPEPFGQIRPPRYDRRSRAKEPWLETNRLIRLPSMRRRESSVHRNIWLTGSLFSHLLLFTPRLLYFLHLARADPDICPRIV